MTDANSRPLLERLEANFVTHAAWIQSRLPGARVEDSPALVLADSGFDTDTFSVVCRARMRGAAEIQIERVLGHFATARRPFSWWVGPLDEPTGLGALLTAAGLRAAESERAMAARLDRIAERSLPPELRIVRARTPEQLADFGRVCAANWDPPDREVERFYASATATLEAISPIRFYVGYVDGEAVSAAELCVAGGVAGLDGLPDTR